MENNSEKCISYASFNGFLTLFCLFFVLHYLGTGKDVVNRE